MHTNNGSLLLHDLNGSLITVYGGHEDGLTVFDFSQQTARSLWAEVCKNATATGYVDGCFADRAVDVQQFETNGQISQHKRTAFDKGHWDMLAELQEHIGAGPIIANHAYNLTGTSAAMIERGGANMHTIGWLQSCDQNGKIVECHMGKSLLNDDMVATFLIG